jgi:hypothetical protein
MADEIIVGGRHRRYKRRQNTRSRRVRRGGGYSFGGSILSDAGGANAGAALWGTNAGSCGTGGDVVNRGGNNTLAGGRRRRRQKRNKRTRRRHRGGNRLALVSPRVGYGYTGTGIAGFTDPTPNGGNSVVV